MEERTTYSTAFILRASKSSKHEALIYCRVTVDMQRAESLKNAYLGLEAREHSLMSLVECLNTQMKDTLIAYLIEYLASQREELKNQQV